MGEYFFVFHSTQESCKIFDLYSLIQQANLVIDTIEFWFERIFYRNVLESTLHTLKCEVFIQKIITKYLITILDLI